MKKRKHWLYMHTLAGQPAQYWPGEQICFLDSHRGLFRLAHSLRQIRCEQRLSEKWRRELGLDYSSQHGYIRLDIDALIETAKAGVGQ